jgi:hypothetical protein
MKAILASILGVSPDEIKEFYPYSNPAEFASSQAKEPMYAAMVNGKESKPVKLSEIIEWLYQNNV